MSRGWLLFGGVLAVGAVVGFTPQKIQCDSLAEFEVTVRLAPGLPPRAISVEAMSERAVAEAVADRYPQEVDGGKWGLTQRPFTGEQMRFAIPCGEVVHRSLLWTWSRAWQFEWLVVVWWPATGPRQAKAVSLPDLCTRRDMVIDLP